MGRFPDVGGRPPSSLLHEMATARAARGIRTTDDRIMELPP
ncbi:hypothetical protein SCE1572_37865 [Sorangium cellulosum So0157-2]|uniref:Uncharacterized protein n=1 Tax=Sorangium cellulosum So0157-2 TaxID=1254432 RepID=S4Y4K9_SORCE|nr:hypothetical protein SCE1572_37865 [Sorangium cellulosum So0157-2]